MKKRFLAVFVFMFLLVSVWVMAEKTVSNPVAVSPGSETGVVTVWQSCPTFSWSAVDQAASYRVAVFESVDANVTNVATYETMANMASPVVSKDIPGPALSWTLSADEKLKTGGRYTWYVQALDADGSALGPWSNGRIFKVEQEVRFAGISEKLGEVLKSYGVKDETITNVLADMKSEVQEVVVNGAGVKEAPGISGVKGTEGTYNTFYGQYAGASTTGYYNTFIGAYAGYTNNSGNYNSFFGYRAGYSNTTGTDNVFLGYRAGYSNNTGSNNIFIGDYAGNSNTTANFNTFIGDHAGYLNTGTYNVFIGESAGYYNTTASNNVFIGFQAGIVNDTGTSNTFIGYRAGKTNTTGNYNVFLGYHAGYFNYDGDYNTFIGYNAGYSNDTGIQNTFLGSFAGYSTDSGYYNTFLGNNAGKNNISGYSNTFIGYNAGYNETGSNKLYIANSSASFPLIYGDFNSSIVAVNGKLGVGVQAPSYPLHMASGAYCSAGGTWTNASSRSLKENIQSLSTAEAMDALNQLNPVKYNYKVDKADKHVGFIAEDVPDLVASADRKGLSPMDVTAVLTKVVQELQKENREQQNLLQEQQEINQEYKKIISTLQERIAKLEQK